MGDVDAARLPLFGSRIGLRYFRLRSDSFRAGFATTSPNVGGSADRDSVGRRDGDLCALRPGGPATLRFCPACAAPLDQAAAPARGERKVITLLFADLAGFTSRSEQFDPEDVRAVLAPYHARLRARGGGLLVGARALFSFCSVGATGYVRRGEQLLADAGSL